MEGLKELVGYGVIGLSKASMDRELNPSTQMCKPSQKTVASVSRRQ
jgi:hypothetical protein